MKRMFLLAMALGMLVLFLANGATVRAQTTCDACGYCQNSEPPGNWETCATCLYGVADPNKTLNQPPSPNKAFTVLGCLEMGAGCNTADDPDCLTKSGAASFTNFLLNFFTTIMGGISFLVMVYGGARVMLAKGDPDAMREGKRYVYGAILGLIVVAMAVFIVKFVGGNLLQLPYLQ